MRVNKKTKISYSILLIIIIVFLFPFVCSYFTPRGRARILDRIRSVYIPRNDESGIYGYIFEYPIDPGMTMRPSYKTYSNRPPTSISIFKVEDIQKYLIQQQFIPAENSIPIETILSSSEAFNIDNIETIFYITTPEESGKFDINLEPGEYIFCRLFRSTQKCKKISIPESPKVFFYQNDCKNIVCENNIAIQNNDSVSNQEIIFEYLNYDKFQYPNLDYLKQNFNATLIKNITTKEIDRNLDKQNDSLRIEIDLDHEINKDFIINMWLRTRYKSFYNSLVKISTKKPFSDNKVIIDIPLEKISGKDCSGLSYEHIYFEILGIEDEIFFNQETKIILSKIDSICPIKKELTDEKSLDDYTLRMYPSKIEKNINDTVLTLQAELRYQNEVFETLDEYKDCEISWISDIDGIICEDIFCKVSSLSSGTHKIDLIVKLPNNEVIQTYTIIGFPKH